MKNTKTGILLVIVLACSGPAAHAATPAWQDGYGYKGWRSHRGEVRHENVTVEKGQVLNEDVVTDKAITIDGVLQGDAVAVGGAPVTVKGEVTGNLVSIGGPVNITGRVKRDVTGIGGPVAISGIVGGDVVSLGGRVELTGAAEVEGDISAIGGAVVKGEKTVHRGEVLNLDMRMVRSVLPRILRTARYAAGNERNVDRWLMGGLVGVGLLVFFSMLATGAVLLLLPAVFLPENVENTANAISGNMWRACGIGALMVVGFFPGLLMMVVSILGIPLVPFALMLYAAAGVLGLSAFSVALQGRFFKGIKKAGPAGLPGKVAAGYAIMAGLMIFGKLIPFIGGVLSLIGCMLLSFGAMLGLGAVWLTRMGSRSYTQPPPPAVPPTVTPPVQ